MLERFINFANEQHLFAEGRTVLLAVSGGRDSVCMAHLAHRAGIHFAIAHCNFHLRGAESDRDEAFVSNLAKEYDVEFHSIGFDTHSYAETHGQSIEEAARVLRYNWFFSLCEQHGYNVVATAHHRDDAVETFFINLFRGTGISGLHGIRPASGRVIRPMLCFSRQEIDDYVNDQCLLYVEDSTNQQLNARRNQLRLEFMPLLRRLYPSIDSTMTANIERLSETEMAFHDYIDQLRQRHMRRHRPTLPWLDMPMFEIDLAEIAQLKYASTVLFEFLHPYGFGADTVRNILNTEQNGKIFRSATHELTIANYKLILSPISPVKVPKLGCEASRVARPCLSDNIYIDADKIREPLHMRLWQPGDRIFPFGMFSQRRTVSDVLKDRHVNRIEKQHAHLLVDDDDRIIWVIGVMADDRFRVGRDTKRIFRIFIA